MLNKWFANLSNEWPNYKLSLSKKIIFNPKDNDFSLQKKKN